jgi:hypothetical protein
MRTSRCRSCNADMVWVVMRASKRRMPLDARPLDEGTIAVDAIGRAEVLTGEALEGARLAGVALYQSHYVSCPQRRQWRKARM